MKTKAAVLKNDDRKIEVAQRDDPGLGPLKLLPGKWKNLPGRGWNMIALPFVAPKEANFPFNYRLLVN